MSDPRPSAPWPSYESGRRLVRRPDQRWIGGVCAAVATYLDVDATLVRLLAVLAFFLGFGLVVPIYLIAWIVIPAA